ncbi:hypothetical protein AK812_SmicGene49142 [Symbiodinium microadriaticum]|uniref:Uncharacterized protein n=1 Tax=Symbiodinium microadriaticum TaxID=2951 RepID=A0A1Q9DEG8_SYMMI|nr:hypothetical protein AK812_SmicGene49142 [Symbiodinium microadriaticum]
MALTTQGLHGAMTQVRRLTRARCLGRTARHIMETEKLERILRRDKRNPYLGAVKRPPRQATQSVSFLQMFPREMLDWSFDDLEQEVKSGGKQAARAKIALHWLLSPLFDKPT